MTVWHALYVPATVLLGMAFGYVAGARAVRAEVAKMKRRSKE